MYLRDLAPSTAQVQQEIKRRKICHPHENVQHDVTPHTCLHEIMFLCYLFIS